MSYEVRKWLDTGEASSGSRPSRTARASATALVRVGFALLGRREQLKFYRHTGAVMAARTAGRPAGAPA